jgi:hypothetical protein
MFQIIILFILLLSVISFLITEFYGILFRGYAPLVSTKAVVLDKLMDEIQFTSGAKVIELGAGRAAFLRAIEKKFPAALLTGIEYSFWPWLSTKLYLALSKSKIKIVRSDLFKTNLKEADLIYCYLNPKMMQDLENKFKTECRPGTQIISQAFPLHNLVPVKTVEGDDHHKIFFYNI